MHHTRLFILTIITFGILVGNGNRIPDATAGIFSRTVRKVAIRRAARRVAAKKAASRVARKKILRGAGRKLAGKQGKFSSPGRSGVVKKQPLYKQIVKEANAVAAKGGKINKAQAETLVRNLPVVKRRGVLANKTMRSHFASSAANNTNAKKKIIRRWEQERGRKWPVDRKGRQATLHHVIPLESGGANKWWNGVPTFGKAPNHSLKGISGPHAKGSVLRKTIQAPRGKMAIKGKGGRVSYPEIDLRKPY